ncbi:Eph receptor tyrosine kinase [Strongyloides ratti]|uniref:receptor protein-tyrosine kinase n=1 Tax=Strongyloides ratti TaxID=34506 RepID=A0A090KXA9_STRRB|nr:Eph receptor tyrosine kinase [Strongyloides ratti]CEF59887.1 Eph receptor tyrosine kinase [Strongyloides ratti]
MKTIYFWKYTTLLYFLIYLVDSAKVLLHDSYVYKEELPYEYFSENSEKSDHPTWEQESYYDEDKNPIVVSTVCYEGNKPNFVKNWIALPKVEKGSAKKLHLEISYSINNCSQTRPFCKDYFDVFYMPLNGDDNTKLKIKNIDNWKHLKNLNIHSGKVTKGVQDFIVTTIDYTPESDAVIFGIREENTCSSILRIRIYFKICPSQTINQFQLPETVVGEDLYGPTFYHVDCVKNAVMLGTKPTMKNAFCKANGEWEVLTDNTCQCLAGYSPNDSGSCSPCTKGSYKNTIGNGICKACPRNSHAYDNGTHICECDIEFYRADNEDASHQCSQPPSSPVNVRTLELKSSEAIIIWSNPTYMGHRSDIYYSITCEFCDESKHCVKCSKSVTSSFNPERIETKQITLKNLEPGRDYIINVFSHNAVSKKAAGNLHNKAIFTFTTAKPFNFKMNTPKLLSHLNNGTLLISWEPYDDEKYLKLGNMYYQIEIKNDKDIVLMDSIQTALKIENIDIYKSHIIKIRVHDPKKGWSEWSDELFIKNKYNKGYKISNQQYESFSNDMIIENEKSELSLYMSITQLYSQNPKIFYIIGCTIVVLLIILNILYFCYTKNNKKGDYFAELVKSQQSDIPYNINITPSHLYYGKQFDSQFLNGFGSATTFVDASANKTYVDPSTYGDLSVAVKEFTKQIPKSNIFLTGEILGGGEFGDVQKGILLLTGSTKSRNIIDGNELIVAVKTLKKCVTEQEKKYFTMEATTMSQFHHDNVLRCIGVVGTDYVEMIITEYMVNGSLINFLKTISGDTYSKVKLAHMCLDVAEGMQYLHMKGYIHRDLASRNILLDQFYRCKIADFGLSRNGFNNENVELEYTNAMAKKIPIRWTSPEALEKGLYTAASDVWSFGILMWEIFTFGERPYYDWSHRKIYEEVLQGYRLPKPDDAPEILYRVMVECWIYDKNERPTFTAITNEIKSYIRIYEDNGDFLANSPLYQSPSDVNYDVARDGNCNSRISNSNYFFTSHPNVSQLPLNTSHRMSNWDIARHSLGDLEKQELENALGKFNIQYLIHHLYRMKIFSVAQLANLSLARLADMDITLNEQKQLAVVIDHIVTSRRAVTNVSRNLKNNQAPAIPQFTKTLNKDSPDGGFLV